MTGLVTSTRLRRAAERARAHVQRERDRLEQRITGLRGELRTLEDTLQALNARDVLLEQLVRDGTPPAGSVSAIASGAMVLRGPHIRRVAVRLLFECHGTAYAVHYREWFDLLTKHGYVVLGERPLATFLTNVSRSPVVARGEEPGMYRLDGRVPARVRRELGEHEAELRDLLSIIERDRGVPDRSLVERLMATVRRLERQLAEAEEAFPAPTQRAAALGTAWRPATRRRAGKRAASPARGGCCARAWGPAPGRWSLPRSALSRSTPRAPIARQGAERCDAV